MENQLNTLTATLEELREPSKVINQAGNQPVAILNRNEVIGYFVPKSASVDIEICASSKEQLDDFVQNKIQDISHISDYLKDK
jgi:antitoxin StbD